MCARRFLLIIFILTLLVVAGAVAIFQFGNRVLIKSAIPRGHYVAPAEAGPDYALESSWLTRPGLENPSLWLPDNFIKEPLPPGDAAIFYIHPTTYLERDRWNATLEGNAASAIRDRIFVQSQASAFTFAGTVWAPRYRQAAFGAFLLDSKDAQQALDLAYGDVLAAFDRFVLEAGERPIILAGHSQGSLHLTRLLRERVARKPIRDRVVAAYVVGWPISVTADLPALGLPACENGAQSGCILSWMSFGDPANPDLVLENYQGSAGFAGGKRRREDMLCTNPVTGTRGGSSPPRPTSGTLVPTANLMSARLELGRVGGTCHNGLLILNGDVPALGPYVLPGNNYHVYDYALFWSAIRRDAWWRLAEWKR